MVNMEVWIPTGYNTEVWMNEGYLVNGGPLGPSGRSVGHFTQNILVVTVLRAADNLEIENSYIRRACFMMSYFTMFKGLSLVMHAFLLVF